jgi:hypothetical protein
MSNENAFLRLPASQVRSELSTLLRKVARQTTRVEILGEDGACECVLISREELEGLERALEVAANGDDLKAVSDAINRFAILTGGEPAQASPSC